MQARQSNPMPETIGQSITSPENVRVIAVVDGETIAAPAYVDGIGSASAWLDNTHPDAGTAVFYKAMKVGDHPALICGGVFAAVDELAFLSREAGQ